MMNLQGKKVLVFGSGKSGIGAADLLEQTWCEPLLFTMETRRLTDRQYYIRFAHHSRTEVYAGELPERSTGHAWIW